MNDSRFRSLAELVAVLRVKDIPLDTVKLENVELRAQVTPLGFEFAIVGVASKDVAYGLVVMGEFPYENAGPSSGRRPRRT